MTDINLELFFSKLDEIKSDIGFLRTDIEVIKNNDLAARLTRLEKKVSDSVKDLHNKIESHKDKEHSSRNTRETWSVIAALVCALATAVAIFYKG